MVVVIDLYIMNGLILLWLGVDLMCLYFGEQMFVLLGDVVDFGDGVIVVFEDFL